MAIQELTGKKGRWIYIDSVNEETENYLKDNFKFHTLDIEDVMSEQQRPKLDVYKYYLFLIAIFPYYDQENRRTRGLEVDIFITGDTLITISQKPFPAFENFFNKIAQSAKFKKMWLDKSPSFILYKLMEKLFRESYAVIDLIDNQIGRVEDNVYENELKSVAHDLAYIRRSVLTLRRILDPQRFTLATMTNINRDFIPQEMGDYFDNIHDYIEKMWVEVENFKDMIDGLHWTNESLISQHTNRVISILTFISVGLMPLTLLAGIYGMNLSRLPLADKPTVVFGLFGLIALMTIFLVFVIVRNRKV